MPVIKELQETIERLIGKDRAAVQQAKFVELEKQQKQARRKLGLD